MKGLKFRFVFMILLNIIYLHVNAQECKINYDRAEDYRKKGQYAKAITYYTKSRDCGDAFYKTRSIAMIDVLTRMAHEQEVLKNMEEYAKAKQSYIIVPSLIYLSADADEQLIHIESSGVWSFKNFSNKIKVTKKNSSTLVVSSIIKNTTVIPTHNTIIISCGDITRTIEVIQDGIPEILEYKSKYMKIPYEGGKFIIDLHTNTKWNVDYDDWYKATPMNDDSTHMVVIVDKNTKNESRTGTIVIRSESGESYDELELYQFANESKIFTSIDSIIKISSETDTIYVPVISENPLWTESDRPSWCLAKKINSDTLMIIVNRNDNYISREGFVNIKSNDRVASIWIRQDASEIPDIFAKKVLGGRNVSFGFTAGYLMPFVKSSSSGTYTGSVINYSLGDKGEDVNYSSQTGFVIGAVTDLRMYKNWYIRTGIEYTHLQYTNNFNEEVVRSVNQGFNVVYKGVFQNNFKEKYKFDLISIPVLASYRFVFDKSNNLQLDFGPVVNLALLGKMTFEGNSNSDNVYPHSYIYGVEGPIIGNRSSEYMRYTGEMNLFDTKVINTTTASIGGMHRDFLNETSAVAAPYNRVNFGLRLGVVYEYAGIQFGMAYTQMLTNMGNNQFWNSGRLPIFGKTSNVSMAGYKHRINTLEFKIGYIFRYKK